MKKILFITTRYPFPVYSGDRSRAFDILKFLSKKNKIDLVCLGKKKEHNKKNLAFCKNIKVFHLNFFSRFINTFFSILKFEPMQNGFFLSNKMKQYIVSAEKNYDTIICHLLRSSQYLPEGFEGKKILEMSDLQSLAYEQLINRLSFLNPIKYIYIIERMLVLRFEKKTFKKFNNIVFVSNVDALEAKKSVSGKIKIHVIEMAKNFNSKTYKHQNKNNKIIFIGNIRFIPNKLACYDFVKNAMEEINFKYPKIKFHIIGNIKYFDKFFLSKYKNVIIHGKINDLKRVFKNSVCGLCNVKISTGFQSKILTYMSYGIPTVLSKSSFINTKFKKNKDVLVFKDNKNLVNEIFRLIENKKIANRLSINSQMLLKKKYDRNKLLLNYDKII